MMRQILGDTIVILAIVNLVRMGIFLVATDVYEFKRTKDEKRMRKQPRRAYRPTIDIIIPAHNEELCVVKTVESVLRSTYPKIHVIVVDDGSTDSTYAKLRYFKRKTKEQRLTIVHQKNGGKASAINNALRKYAKSNLVMVLDADSQLHLNAIANMTQHFRDRKVVAAASNVKIIDDYRLIGLAQRLEYLISYRNKRALTVLNMEYIIGGVGSTFRRRVVESVNFYDTDTITEDIDFTLKLIAQRGNKSSRIIYAADSIAYTEAVMSMKAIIKQRFRWKYGRLQSFMKHKRLFFSHSGRFDKRLTWLNLPYALFGEFALLLEPVLLTFVVVMAFLYGDSKSLLSVYLIITVYVVLNVWGESTETWKSKARLIISVPVAYALMYLLTIAEYGALFQSLKKVPALFREGVSEGKWEHVERAGVKT
jgi:poly-beta-1,6-N-acetyl-D-glucosamine synthase